MQRSKDSWWNIVINSPFCQLTLEVSTHARSGLLLWQGAGDSFLALTLADGHAVLNVAHTQVQVLGRSIREESSVEGEYIANIMLSFVKQYGNI